MARLEVSNTDMHCGIAADFHEGEMGSYRADRMFLLQTNAELLHADLCCSISIRCDTGIIGAQVKVQKPY